jgi:hypothetical protein
MWGNGHFVHAASPRAAFISTPRRVICMARAVARASVQGMFPEAIRRAKPIKRRSFKKQALTGER